MLLALHSIVTTAHPVNGISALAPTAWSAGKTKHPSPNHIPPGLPANLNDRQNNNQQKKLLTYTHTHTHTNPKPQISLTISHPKTETGSLFD